MEKFNKLLHKKLDTKVDKITAFQEMKKKVEEVLKNDKIEEKDTNEFSIYQKEIIANGIINKRAIENAFFEGHVKMNDYYDTLDYKEKQRLMNYEIHKCCEELITFMYEDTKIYIPFFDQKMNRIYQDEMVLFDLKQYHRIVHEYKDLMDTKQYGLLPYQSKFSSLEAVGQYQDMASVFCPYTNRLFLLKNEDMIDYITLSNVSNALLQDISLAWFYEDYAALIQHLHDAEIINDKLANKLEKIGKKAGKL